MFTKQPFCLFNFIFLDVICSGAYPCAHNNDSISYYYDGRSGMPIFGMQPLQTEPVDLSCKQKQRPDNMIINDTEQSAHNILDLPNDGLSMISSPIVNHVGLEQKPQKIKPQSNLIKNRIEVDNLTPIEFLTAPSQLAASNVKTRRFQLGNKEIKHRKIRTKQNKKPLNSIKRVNGTKDFVAKNNNFIFNSSICFNTDLKAYNFRKGLLNAVLNHCGYENPVQTNTYVTDIRNCRYESNNYIAFLDFHAFYDKHIVAVSKNNILNSKDGSKEHRKKIIEQTVLDGTKIENLIVTLKNINYYNNEFKLVTDLLSTQCKDYIKFVPKINIVYDMIYDHSGLSSAPRFNVVNSSIIKSITKSFNFHRSNMIFQTDNAELSLSYITCISEMLFCKDNTNSLFILKPELWDLQLFMPELYFYIIWKMKQLNNINQRINGRKLHLIAEIDWFYSITMHFIKLCCSVQQHTQCVDLIKHEIFYFKKFILKYLKNFHQNTTTFLLYKYGLGLYKTKSTWKKHSCISLSFCILAFTGHGPEFERLKKVKVEKYILRSRVGMTRADFVNDILMRREKLKRDVIATLQLVAMFFTLAKNRKSEILEYEPIVISYKLRTLIIYQKKSDPFIYILSLTNNQAISYLNEHIYAALRT